VQVMNHPIHSRVNPNLPQVKKEREGAGWGREGGRRRTEGIVMGASLLGRHARMAAVYPCRAARC